MLEKGRMSVSMSRVYFREQVIVSPSLFNKLSRVFILSSWFEQQEGITNPGKVVESSYECRLVPSRLVNVHRRRYQLSFNRLTSTFDICHACSSAADKWAWLQGDSLICIPLPIFPRFPVFADRLKENSVGGKR